MVFMVGIVLGIWVMVVVNLNIYLVVLLYVLDDEMWVKLLLMGKWFGVEEIFVVVDDY